MERRPTPDVGPIDLPPGRSSEVEAGRTDRLVLDAREDECRAWIVADYEVPASFQSTRVLQLT